MRDDVAFAMAVAGRAVVRFKGSNPYTTVTTAVTETKMGAWNKPFSVLLVVGESRAVAEIAACVRASLDLQEAPDAADVERPVEELIGPELRALFSRRERGAR